MTGLVAAAGRAGAALAVLAGATGPLVATPAAAAPAQVACPQPYEPQYAAAGRSLPLVPIEVPLGPGPSIDHIRLVGEADPDTDGDGAADVVTAAGDEADWGLTIQRADGTVRLRAHAVPGDPASGLAYVYQQRAAAWWGDVDGDGRDDLVVTAVEEDGPRAYLVHGAALAPGEHELAAVAVRLPDDMSLVQQVGDHDGDGGDDLLVGTDAGVAVVSGRATLAPGPGRALAERPPAIRTFPGVPPTLGVLRLDPDGPPTIVTLAGGDEQSVELVVHADPPVRLRTARAAPFGSGLVSGFLAGDHRVVEHAQHIRGSSAVWQWDLDDPCRPPSPAPLPPPSAPDAGTHTVAPGEWLWRIARETLTARNVDASPPAVARYAAAIHAANAAVIGPDPNRILPGMVLTLPPTA